MIDFSRIIQDLPLLGFVPLLLAVEGFFSGAELALLSADRLKLKQAAQDGKPGAALALTLVERPERVLSATLVMTNLCVVLLSGLFTLLYTRWESASPELLTVVTVSPLVVLLGELIPKSFFQARATTLAPWVARPVTVAYYALYPVTQLVSAYTSRVSRLIAPLERALGGRRPSTRDELASLLSGGKRETAIKASERRILRRILDFRDSQAKHAMIPLVKVEAIDLEADVREAIERFEAHRHSRMPVYEGRIDNIVGVLHYADLFSATDLRQSIRLLLSQAHYVAETQSLEDILRLIREGLHKSQKAQPEEEIELVVVVDEHGGAVGILTAEDLFEEIVGEIDDEYDSTNTVTRPAGDDAWITQARAEIGLLNEELKLDLPEGEYETLGGFLLQQFGRIPAARDELFFNTSAGTLKFTIRRASPRQIESVLIERLPAVDSETR